MQNSHIRKGSRNSLPGNFMSCRCSCIQQETSTAQMPKHYAGRRYWSGFGMQIVFTSSYGPKVLFHSTICACHSILSVDRSKGQALKYLQRNNIRKKELKATVQCRITSCSREKSKLIFMLSAVLLYYSHGVIRHRKSIPFWVWCRFLYLGVWPK